MGLDMYLYGVKEEFGKHDYNIGGYKEMNDIGEKRIRYMLGSLSVAKMESTTVPPIM